MEKLTVISSAAASRWYRAVPVTELRPSFADKVEGVKIYRRGNAWYLKQDGVESHMNMGEGFWLYHEDSGGNISDVTLLAQSESRGYLVCGKDGRSMMPLMNLDMEVYEEIAAMDPRDREKLTSGLYGIIDGFARRQANAAVASA